MLEDARFQDGRVHLSKRVIDLRESTRTVVREARTDLALNYNLHYSEPREAVLVDADQARVGTILRNLLDNAIKYSPEGGTIECRLEDEGGFAVGTLRTPSRRLTTAPLRAWHHPAYGTCMPGW